jgi:DNA-binding MarR family transcriptional regulator
LKQSKPFSSLAEETLLNLERTADCFRRDIQQALKPYGLTGTQYNALRILRGALPDGLACSELGQRLVSSDPDITRLLARLMRQGLVQRNRATGDRRVVITRITPSGLSLLETVVPVVDQHVLKSVQHMTENSLQTLVDLLEEARFPCAASEEIPSASQPVRQA